MFCRKFAVSVMECVSIMSEKSHAIARKKYASQCKKHRKKKGDRRRANASKDAGRSVHPAPVSFLHPVFLYPQSSYQYQLARLSTLTLSESSWQLSWPGAYWVSGCLYGRRLYGMATLASAANSDFAFEIRGWDRNPALQDPWILSRTHCF